MLSLIYNGTRGVAKVRQSRNVDVFLCAWVLPSGLYLYLDRILRGSRTPYVLWALGSDVNKYKGNPLVRQAIKRIAGSAGHLYADGYNLCDEVRRITGRSCEFLPTFRPIQMIEERATTNRGVPSFLYVGRHALVKGVDVLVDGLIALRQLGDPEYLFNIVGDGELTSKLQAQVQAAGLASKVHFRGRIDEDELYQLYATCDCVVIPSRSESIPVVLSEALQAKRPLIVTDVGDMGRIVREHKLGEVVPQENPQALAASLRRFIDRPSSLDEAGRSQVLEELMFESAAPRLLRKLEELVAST